MIIALLIFAAGIAIGVFLAMAGLTAGTRRLKHAGVFETVRLLQRMQRLCGGHQQVSDRVDYMEAKARAALVKLGGAA